MENDNFITSFVICVNEFQESYERSPMNEEIRAVACLVFEIRNTLRSLQRGEARRGEKRWWRNGISRRDKKCAFLNQSIFI